MATVTEREAVGLAELPAGAVYSALDSSPGGLSAEEAAIRLARAGPNVFAEPPPPRLVRKFLSNFGHLMAVLLWVGGAVALVAGLPQLAIAIWVVNIVNGLFSFWQEFRAEQATAALRQLLPTFATVLRDGVPVRVPAEALVTGDVLVLEEGDRISADARLVDHVSLRVDQSTMSGESRPTRKASEACDAAGRTPAEIPNMIYAGTSVAAGRGRAVVAAVGSRTQLGRVARLTQETPDAPSPLQLELRRLSVVVSIVAVSVGVVFFGLAVVLGGLAPARGFIFALGMIVAFVPEGLLPTVTLSLAMGTQRMARRNALVKKLSAVETLGSTSVICTDKTGTLTQNEMTVTAAFVDGVAYQLSGVGYRPEGGVSPAASPRLVELFEVAGAACNARVHEEDGRWVAVGDPTEAAVVVAAGKAGARADWERVGEIPFDSGRKRMSTIDCRDGTYELHVKGAADVLLALSVGGAGDSSDQTGMELWRSEIDRLSALGLRVLGVARRRLAVRPAGMSDEELEAGLEFLGLIAMQDPPRPEVAAAVATCRAAGIRIVMITGDYGLTSQAIGRRIGMVGDAVRVVNGDELDTFDDAALATMLQAEVLFARATPEHKLRVVAALQALGHVVAVTGDGVNDAPALKKADIGVAMGITGTDVAKEAADMILLDDNFASIVAAVEEGRAVFANIRKFTTYILTSNTPEAVPFIVFAFSGGRIPIALDVMHILAIDLGTDLAPALALGAEPPEPGIMDRPPRPRTEHIIDRALLLRAYVWLGPVQAAFVIAAFFGAYRLMGYDGFDSLPGEGVTYRAAAGMALSAVVATQIGNLFAQRSRGFRDLGSNRLILWGIASELVVIAALIYVPWLGGVIGTAPFPAVGWLWLLLGVPLLPLVDHVRRRFAHRLERSSS
ncbi:MAG: cation-translocating P-type ATPase [Acidimicrobiia bacterium]